MSGGSGRPSKETAVVVETLLMGGGTNERRLKSGSISDDDLWELTPSGMNLLLLLNGIRY